LSTPEELLKEAQRALDMALKAGAQDAVIGASFGYSTEFEYRDGKLEKVQQSASRGLNVALYVDDRYSTHGTTDLRPAQVQRFIEDAVVLTRHLEPDPFRKIPEAKLFANRPAVDLELIDPTVNEISREQCVAWLTEMDQIAHGERRVVTANSGVSFGYSASARVTSNGFVGTRAGTNAGYGSHVTLDEGNGKRPDGFRYVHGRYLNTLPDPLECSRLALQRGLARLGSEKGKSAKTAMVVDAENAGNLLRYLAGGLSAGSIQQKRSFLANKKDQKIASELLTIVDDPLIVRGLGSRLYDGEGISAKRLPVIEKGVLKNFYIDTYYGRKLGWEPTSGGSANLQFELGSKNLEQLISDVGEGVYVNGFLGGNADSTTGDFSLGVRGHRIENGKKAGPVGEMNITGNLLELFSNLAAVGNDPTPYSSTRTPTLVFKDVNFSGQ
jgi:PmbA protein